MFDLLIEWKDEYNIGIPIVDEQHRGIISIINSLSFLTRQGKDLEELSHIIKMIEQYTRMHFAIEEEMLEKAQYLHLEQHQHLHQNLLQALCWDVRYEALAKKDPAILLAFLNTWWTSHILTQDRLYASCLTGKAMD